MDKLTSKFQEALADAQSLALGKDHQFIEAAHLLLALLDQEGGSIKPLLAHSNINVPSLRADTLAAISRSISTWSP
jgi:ATP-dependent Clp protease ATP-binding subunit ClpB